MKNATSLELYRYWSNLRAERMAPLRHQVDPRQITRILPDVFTLRTIRDEDGPVFSLTGTRLYNLFQYELRGFSFASLWNDVATAYVTKIATGVQDHGLPVVFDVAGESRNGSARIEFEMLLLPLDEEGGKRRRILGCLSSEPVIGDFSNPMSHLSLLRSRLLDVPSRAPLVASNDETILPFTRRLG